MGWGRYNRVAACGDRNGNVELQLNTPTTGLVGRGCGGALHLHLARSSSSNTKAETTLANRNSLPDVGDVCRKVCKECECSLAASTRLTIPLLGCVFLCRPVQLNNRI